MEPSLQKMLLFLILYTAMGLLFVYSAKTSKSKIENFFSALLMIFYASFLFSLDVFLLLSVNSIELNNVELENQAITFQSYVCGIGLFGLIVYGSIGAKVMSSLLMPTTNSIEFANDEMKDLLQKVDKIDKWVGSQNKNYWWRACLQVFLFILTVFSSAITIF